ncbi:carbohydrate ABC transporter permease [Halomicroarcula sp. GCM10025710]
MTDYATRRRAANAARFVLLAAALVVFLFPFYWILRTSILPTQTIYESISPIPTDFTLAHYQAAIDNGFLNAIVNSLIAGVGTTLLTTVVALFGAYSILRYTYPARQKVAKMVLLTYMFPHVALIVPMYRLAADLGMLGNPVTLVIVHTMLALPFCMWILQSFLSDIPRELEEAALVEGDAVRRVRPYHRPAGNAGYHRRRYVRLHHVVGEYMFAYVLLTTESSQTVPVALQQLLGSYAIDWGLLAAACVLSTLPVLALFWLMAKYLGEGIAKGAGVV